MADIPASNWVEDDNSNTTAAPDGAPEGMAPSGVNNVLRAHQGAIKRWYDWTIPKTTGGTSTAYTLSYTVSPGALVDGMTHLVQFNAVNGASPTLNVNTLGAKPLHFYLNGTWAVLPANMLSVDQIVEVTYNSAAGTYRCIDLQPTLVQSASAASTVDFTAIPANVNNLTILIAGTISTNGVGLQIRTYGADAVLDSGGSDYAYGSVTGISGAVASSTTSADSKIALSSGILAANPINIELSSANIQALQFTQFNIRALYNENVGSAIVMLSGGGLRLEADRITGIRLLTSSGTFTGKVTVILS